MRRKHYQSDCPKGKGKGKLGWFEAPDSYADWEYGGSEEGSLKYLSSLTLKKDPVPTSNYWSALQAEKEGDEPTAIHKLADVALGDVGHVYGLPRGKPVVPARLAVSRTLQVLVRNHQG